MKKNILMFGIFVIFVSCKSQKDANTTTTSVTTTTTTTTEMTVPAGNTKGKVSHQYRTTGCATVIVANQDGNEIVLIPKDKLASDFDVDGLEIQFNYRTLKMPQPAGCNVGIPAEITDLSKK